MQHSNLGGWKGWVPLRFQSLVFCFNSNSNMPNSHYSIVKVVVEHAIGKSRTLTEELVKAPGLPCSRRSTVQIPPQTLQVCLLPDKFCTVVGLSWIESYDVDFVSIAEITVLHHVVKYPNSFWESSLHSFILSSVSFNRWLKCQRNQLIYVRLIVEEG